MATVARRRNRYVVDWRDATGRRRWKSFMKKKEAEAYRDEVAQNTRRGIVTDDNIKFDQLVQDWKKSHLETSVRPSTKADYKSLLKVHIEPFFKGYRLREIQRPLVLKFRASMLDDCVGRRTVNKALSLSGSLWRYAELNRQVHHNPFVKVMLPKAAPDDVDYEDEVIEVLSVDEQRRLIDTAQGGTRILLMTALATGLRQGELLGLKWDDLELKVGQLHVRRQYTRGAFAPLKTNNAKRKVPLPPSLVRELRKWKLACPTGPYDLVFPNSKGNPESPANLLKRGFYPALRRAGIRRIRFHGLRHTYVSSLIEYGVTNIKRLQMLLGHSSAMITLDTYTHLLPDSDDGIAAAAESALFDSGSKTVAVDTTADAEASASV